MRSMLRSYNTHVCTIKNYHFRYVHLVKNDVYYQGLVWTREPHDFKQMISVGGLCAPRSWVGRAICKAFGTPNWGVRQPGHAASSFLEI